jgi:hypothetical protein
MLPLLQFSKEPLPNSIEVSYNEHNDFRFKITVKKETEGPLMISTKTQETALVEYRSAHLEIPLHVVAEHLHVPPYLLFRLAYKLGFFNEGSETHPTQHSLLAKDLVFFTPEQVTQLREAFVALKTGTPWATLNNRKKTASNHKPSDIKVKITPLYAKAMQGEAWIPQFQRMAWVKPSPIKKNVTPAHRTSPFSPQSRPFHRVGIRQALWEHPPVEAHPFIR